MVIDANPAPDSKSKGAEQKKGNGAITISTTEPLDVRADISKDWMDWVTWGLNCVLVGIAIFGVLYARRTLKAIEGQLTEMKATGVQTAAIIAQATKQAEAAVLNAQAVINSERPWIVISVESEEPNQFIFRATNVGRTPANIKAIWSSPVRLNRGEGLELSKEYYNDDGLFTYPPRLLPPTESCMVGQCNIAELRGKDTVEAWMTNLNGSFSSVYFYGKVMYSDVLGIAHISQPVTRWFYWYTSRRNGFIPDPRHPEYNTYADDKGGEQKAN